MGFFTELLGAALPIAGAILGGPAGAGAGVAIAGLLGGDAPVTQVGTGAQLAAMRGVSPVAGTNVAQSLAAAGVKVTGACPTTTGRLRKVTTVQTIDPVTGKVCKTESFPGGVAVRASDVAAAKRFFRQIRKLDAKLPRKTQKPSRATLLKDRLIENALDRAGDDPSCPK